MRDAQPPVGDIVGGGRLSDPAGALLLQQPVDGVTARGESDILRSGSLALQLFP